MRGNTLNELIQMLRNELKIADSPSLSKNTRNSHAHAIRSAQDRLYAANDWPFKVITRDISLEAGERYYDLPENMDMEDLRTAKVFHAGGWYNITRGISELDYSSYNSELDQRSDPVRKWDLHNDPDTNNDMVELWPVPASDGPDIVSGGPFVRFHGQRKLGALVQDSDRADLDGLLIVLTAACDFVQPKDIKKAETKAASHLFALKRNLSNGETFVMGGGEDPNDRRYRPPQIVIAG